MRALVLTVLALGVTALLVAAVLLAPATRLQALVLPLVVTSARPEGQLVSLAFFAGLLLVPVAGWALKARRART